MSMSRLDASRDIDNAQLSYGYSVGPWTVTSLSYTLERDARYTIKMYNQILSFY